MLQPAQGSGFLLEPAEQFQAREFRLDEFQRDCPAGKFLFGFINSAHAAIADQTHNAVTANRCAWLQPRTRGGTSRVLAGHRQQKQAPRTTPAKSFFVYQRATAFFAPARVVHFPVS
jgi:hypothetical protein